MAEINERDLEQLFKWAEALVETLESIDESLMILSRRKNLGDD